MVTKHDGYCFRIRDVVFSLYLLNKDDDKAIGFEINWDANRDPSQKLIISGSYRKNAPFNYLAGFKVIYPGKYIKGDYKFILEGIVSTIYNLVQLNKINCN